MTFLLSILTRPGAPVGSPSRMVPGHGREEGCAAGDSESRRPGPPRTGSGGSTRGNRVGSDPEDYRCDGEGDESGAWGWPRCSTNWHPFEG